MFHRMGMSGQRLGRKRSQMLSWWALSAASSSAISAAPRSPYSSTVSTATKHHFTRNPVEQHYADGGNHTLQWSRCGPLGSLNGIQHGTPPEYSSTGTDPMNPMLPG